MRLPFSRTADADAQAPDEPREDSPWGTVRFLLFLVVLAWAFRSLVVAPFSIPTGSMLPTLYIGDYVVVAKWPYGYSRHSFPFGFPPFGGRILGGVPERGDVVVFRHPRDNLDLIKRVVGLPGDTVAVEGGQLVLNGRPLAREPLPPFRMPVSANSPCKVVPPATPMMARVGDRAYCLYPAYRETLPGGPSYAVIDQVEGMGDDFPPTRVPAGRVFLMGDNRDDSADSRVPLAAGGIGMVPQERLIGRAQFTFWSTDGSASWFKPWTWFSALRSERIGKSYSGVPE